MENDSACGSKINIACVKELLENVESFAKSTEFLSSTLNGSHLSASSNLFMPLDGRESAIPGSSTHLLNFGFIEDEFNKENCAATGFEIPFPVSKASVSTVEVKLEDNGSIAASAGDWEFRVPDIPPRFAGRRSASFGDLEQAKYSNNMDRSESEAAINLRDVEFRISPGTKASEQRMEKKLARLKARDLTRKETLRKMELVRTSSRQKVDLEASAQKFVSIHRSDNELRSVPFRLGTPEMVEKKKTTPVSTKLPSTDTTYVVQSTPKRFEETYNIPSSSDGDARSEIPRPEIVHSTPLRARRKDPVIHPQQRHEAGLKTWINFLIRQRYGNVGMRELTEGGRVVADAVLCEILKGRMISEEIGDIQNQGCDEEKKLVAEVVARIRNVYLSHDMKTKICEMIEKGRLETRKEIHLFSDTGLQMRLMKIFFSFHSFWLRAGLEAVFNVSFSGPSNTVCRRLAAFIAQRFFKEPSVVADRRCAKGRNRTLITDYGREKLGCHFQNKMYQFLYVVDSAKSDERLRDRTPCLFLKDSAYKNTTEVLCAVQREILSGTGNAVKALARVGFKPKYTQGFFEEYRYTVDNLSSDLCDGVILSRLVELVCGLPPNYVTNQLRNPSGDRIRKVGNIRKVFDVATANGVDLGEIKPESIVQGMHDATMEAIWRLIGSYVMCKERLANDGRSDELDPERLWNAAITIQRYYRGYRTRRLFAGRAKICNERFVVDGHNVEMDPEGLLNEAIAREPSAGKLEVSNEKPIDDGRNVEMNPEGLLNEVIAREPSSEGLEVSDERFVDDDRNVEMNPEGLLNEAIAREPSAELLEVFDERFVDDDHNTEMNGACLVNVTVAQRLSAGNPKICNEGFVDGEVRDEEVGAESLLNEAVDGKLPVERPKRLGDGCVMVTDTDDEIDRGRKLSASSQEDSCSVAVSEKRSRRRELSDLKKAQKEMRREQRKVIRELKELFRRQKAAVVIQRFWRGFIVRRVFNHFKRRKHKRAVKAAIVIQKYWRGYIARCFFKEWKSQEQDRANKAAITIQRHWRGYVTRQLLERLKQKEHSRFCQAAIVIQRYWRGYVARGHLKQLKQEEHGRFCRAATVIQRHWRGYVARCLLKQLKQEERSRSCQAATVIQCFWRCCIARRTLKELKCLEQERMTEAAVIIQRFWRGCLARRIAQNLREQRRKRFVDAAIVIQRFWRGYVARRLFEELKRYELERSVNAAIVIQRFWRGHVARQLFEELKRYERERADNAAVVIQRFWRGRAARRMFEELKRYERERSVNAAISIQRFWRGFVAKRLFKELKVHEQKRREQAAVVIQKHWRGFLARKKLADHRRTVLEKMVEFRLKDMADAEERSRPVLSRVIDALEDLVSCELQRRDRAARTLGRITALSDECGLYIYENHGLAYLLDALDSSNRGVHENTVVAHLLLCLYSILRIKKVRREIQPDDQQIRDLVRSCFHYFSAYHRVYDAVLNASKCLLFIASLNPKATKFPSAKYYLTQATGRFRHLSADKELAIAIREMRKVYLVEDLEK